MNPADLMTFDLSSSIIIWDFCFCFLDLNLFSNFPVSVDP